MVKDRSERVNRVRGRGGKAAYEADRLPKTAEIVRNNRKGGPEGVIDDVLSRAEREAIVKGYAQLAGFAKEQVNRGDNPHHAVVKKSRQRRV